MSEIDMRRHVIILATIICISTFAGPNVWAKVAVHRLLTKGNDRDLLRIPLQLLLEWKKISRSSHPYSKPAFKNLLPISNVSANLKKKKTSRNTSQGLHRHRHRVGNKKLLSFGWAKHCLIFERLFGGNAVFDTKKWRRKKNNGTLREKWCLNLWCRVWRKKIRT